MVSAHAILISLLLLAPTGPKLHTRFPSAIVGVWRSTEDDQLVIEIYSKSDNRFEGKVKSGRNKEEVGKVILKELRADEKKQQFVGLFSPPDSDQQLEAIVQLIDERTLNITVTKFFFTRELILKKDK